MKCILKKLKSEPILSVRDSENQINYRLEHQFAVKDLEFLRCMRNLLGPDILSGNKVESLQNGNQIFPAMLKAIKNSKKSISFETYIYWAGDIGRDFSKALCERSKAGVKVHVILDWMGSDKIDKDYLKNMESSGIEIEKYHPLHWYHLNRLNNRTHRKLLIIDGKIGFIGGAGIADQWKGNAESKDYWRDSHYRIQGPAVAQMQAIFNDNWIKSHHKILLGNEYFPELKPITKGVMAQIFKSSNGNSESVRLMYLLSISCAIKSIRLQAAYFVPDELAIQTLLAAKKRGVKIEIIVPGQYVDTEIVRKASRSLWGILLDAGIKIYEYQPTIYHCKVIIVDDIWVSVGSANFDNRSFRLNDEANLNIYNAIFAAKQIKFFEDDKRKSRLITLKDFKEQSKISKILDKLAIIFRRQI